MTEPAAIEGSAVEEAPPAPQDDRPAATLALERRPVSQEVLVPLDVGEQTAAMRTYQEGLRALLDETDWQSSGRDKFVKKSGWRKIATWFNLSVEPISEHVERGEDGSPLRARVWVRAIAPNGRAMAGDGACSVEESRFAKPGGRGKLENDILGTATTRAKNRAISDLVGMGAVSAEEVDGQGAAAAELPEWAAPASDQWMQATFRALTYLLGVAPEDPGLAPEPDDQQWVLDVFREIGNLNDGVIPLAVARAVTTAASKLRERKTNLGGQAGAEQGDPPAADPDPDPAPEAEQTMADALAGGPVDADGNPIEW